MSHTRIRTTQRLIFAAAAGLVAASALCGPGAVAGGVGADGGRVMHGAFRRGNESQAQWRAVNRHAMQSADVDSGERPFVYQRVAAGSGLTAVSAEVRGVPRAEQGGQLRGGGSIRADIARYNEERSTPRASSRQTDDPRSAANSTYRN